MVGPPKSLLDLRKLDADLRVTCRRCGRTHDFHREALTALLMQRHKNLAWDMLPSHFRCSVEACRSKDVRLAVVPFGRPKSRRTAVERFVRAVEEMLAAIGQGDENVPALQRMSAARLEYEEAKAALIAWSVE